VPSAESREYESATEHTGSAMNIRQGERVRVRNPYNEYTGCRGTVVDPDEDGIAALGRLVAIDGENGIARAFLTVDLEPLRAARVSPRPPVQLRSDVEHD